MEMEGAAGGVGLGSDPCEGRVGGGGRWIWEGWFLLVERRSARGSARLGFGGAAREVENGKKNWAGFLSFLAGDGKSGFPRPWLVSRDTSVTGPLPSFRVSFPAILDLLDPDPRSFLDPQIAVLPSSTQP